MQLKNILFLSLLLFSSLGAIAQDTYESLIKKANEEIENKKYTEAMASFDAAFKLGTDNKSDLAWSATIAAVCAQQAKDLKKAIEYNNIAIDNNTTDVTVYESQIDLAKELKDNETMEKVLLKGRDKLEGQYQKYTTKLLYFYFNSQMFDKVLTTADEVLAYKPNHLKSHYFKGYASLVKGDATKAIENFEKALSVDPKDLNTNKQLGFIYYNHGSSIHDKAKAKYNGIAKPNRVDYHNYRVKIEESIKPYKKAIPYLESCYNTKPTADVKGALNMIYTRLGEKEKAAKYQ